MLTLALAQGGGAAAADPMRVSLPVVVRDAHDRPVTTLTDKDFEIGASVCPSWTRGSCQPTPPVSPVVSRIRTLARPM